VRLDALLPLHPAWSDVQQLDALLAEAQKAKVPAPSIQPSIPLPEAVLPPPLSVNNRLSGNLTEARIQQTAQNARQRVERLRSTLDTLHERALEKRQELLRKEASADIAQKRADILATVEERVTKAEEQARVETAPLRKEIRDRKFREIALQSQVAALNDNPRDEAQRRLIQVQKEIKELEARLNSRLAGIREGIEKEADRQIEDYRQQRLEQEAAELAQFRAELNRRASEAIAHYEAEVERTLSSLEPLSMPSVPRTPVLRTQRLPSPAQVAEKPRPVDTARITKEIDARTEALRAQRKRLVDFIADDTRRRVETFAAGKQWQIAYAPAPGRADRTEEAAQWLRAEWTP
jgi:hypothetical protein